MAKYKKFIVAALGAVVVILSGLLQADNIIPEKYTPWCAGVVAVLTAYGVRQARNAPLDYDAGHFEAADGAVVQEGTQEGA